MSDHCVCGHLHRQGECSCGCTLCETEQQANKPSGFKREEYDGFYLGKRYSA